MPASYTHFGKNHLHFNEINSTNKFARELLSKTKPMDGSVISADFQSQGRGQFDRNWESNPAENAILTIIVYPEFIKTIEQFKISKLIAVSIVEALMHFEVENLKIKWPNDIYAGRNKICGILIENQISENKLINMVIGVGINVNQIKFGEKMNASSIVNETGNISDIQLVIETLLNIISNKYNSLKQNNYEENEYSTHLLKINETVLFSNLSDKKKSSATLEGVDDFGRILLNGRAYLHGEIEINYF